MSGKKIVIVNYEMGNTFSIVNSLKYLGYTPIISYDEKVIASASALILPGVGAFKDAMSNIKKLNLNTILKKSVLENRTPILGICLGMQIMSNLGYEGGQSEGLSFIEGKVISIENLHVGFNSIEILKKNPLFTSLENDTHFYFDHSFHFLCDKKYISSYTLFKNKLICASIQKDNIFATQFHPERSQISGLKLLRNFLNFVEKQNG